MTELTPAQLADVVGAVRIPREVDMVLYGCNCGRVHYREVTCATN